MLSSLAGQETSRVQISLTAASTLTLLVLVMARDAIDDLMRTGTNAILRPVLQRVNSGFYRFSAPGQRVELPWLLMPSLSDRQLANWVKRTLVGAFCCTATAMITGGADGHFSSAVHPKATALAFLCTGAVAASVLLALTRSWWVSSSAAQTDAADQDSSLEVECPLCLDRVPTKRSLVLSPCGHTICVECFNNAPARVKSQCAVCRANVDSSFVISESKQQ